MKISTENRKKLVDEIKFIINQMKAEEDPKSKLYYFSAIYGIMPRIFNFEFNADLVFAHFVVSSTYNQINGRLQNPDNVVKIPDDLFDKLLVITEEFLNAIENNKNLYEVLKKFTTLGFITTGNGYYIYKKGLFKI